MFTYLSLCLSVLCLLNCGWDVDNIFLKIISIISVNDTSDMNLEVEFGYNSLTTLEEAVYGDIFPFVTTFFIDGELYWWKKSFSPAQDL